jgi:acetyl-CoA carboxylase alpha subunit
MKMIRDVNALSAAVAVISKEKVDEKTRTKEIAEQKALKKVEKQKATESAEEAQRREMMPYLTELMGRFETAAGDNFDGVKALSATLQKDILKLYDGVRLKGMSTMKKTDLVIEVTN